MEWVDWVLGGLWTALVALVGLLWKGNDKRHAEAASRIEALDRETASCVDAMDKKKVDANVCKIVTSQFTQTMLDIKSTQEKVDKKLDDINNSLSDIRVHMARQNGR